MFTRISNTMYYQYRSVSLVLIDSYNSLKNLNIQFELNLITAEYLMHFHLINIILYDILTISFCFILLWLY